LLLLRSCSRSLFVLFCFSVSIFASSQSLIFVLFPSLIFQGPTNKEASVEEEAPVVATEAESVGEVSEGTVAGN
jgi:hypothetical protein